MKGNNLTLSKATVSDLIDELKRRDQHIYILLLVDRHVRNLWSVAYSLSDLMDFIYSKPLTSSWGCLEFDGLTDEAGKAACEKILHMDITEDEKIDRLNEGFNIGRITWSASGEEY